MKNSNFRNSVRGFSLIEVLIAVVIMSVGLLALASLQLGIVRSSSEAKAQTIALNLARDKLEDLTSYRILNEATGTNCPTANDSYQCITSGNDALADDGAGSLGGVNFTRTWTVQRYVGSGGVFALNGANTAAWTAAVPRNEFKSMIVTVAWTDATGAPQQVAVKDAVGAMDPKDIALVRKVVTSGTPRPAQGKIWDPGTVSGVIPIAVGSGTSSAATNPKPEVLAGTSVVETRFDVLTYSGLNSGAADAQARVETAVVGCTCQIATLAVTERGLRPTYWNGLRYAAPSVTAAAPPAEAASVSQSDKCDVCCRDHHDPSGTTTAKFSPFVDPHEHFNSNATGATAIVSGEYKEACRLIRVNGIFRVGTDLNNDYFALLATKELASSTARGDSPIPDATATVSYQDFVIDYMNTRFTLVANLPSPAGATDSQRAAYNTYRTTTPCVSGGPSDTAGSSSCALEETAVSGTQRSPMLNQPGSINIGSSDTKWNHSRGMYIDYLEPEAILVITNAKTNCVSQSGTVFSECVLKYLPFTSINLTEIANWESAATAQAVVTNNDYSESISSTDPVRGKVVQGTTPASGTDVNVRTDSRKTNSGLLDLSFDAISPDDNLKLTDYQAFRIQAAGSPVGENGDFEVDVVGTSGSTPDVTYITGVQASQACNAGNGPNYLHHVCSVTNASSSGGLGVANSMQVKVLNYNAQVDGANNGATTSAGQVTCYDSAGLNPLSVPSGEKYTAHTCKNYAVSTATIVSSLGVAGVAGSPATSVADGALSESTTISFPLINQNDVITVTFGSPVNISPALSCTYVPKNPSGFNYTVTQANCTP